MNRDKVVKQLEFIYPNTFKVDGFRFLKYESLVEHLPTNIRKGVDKVDVDTTVELMTSWWAIEVYSLDITRIQYKGIKEIQRKIRRIIKKREKEEMLTELDSLNDIDDELALGARNEIEKKFSPSKIDMQPKLLKGAGSSKKKKKK